MAFEEVAQSSLRGTYYDKVLKQIASPLYKFKQAVNISTTGAWTNYFFRGKTDVLTGASGNATKGIPRGAEFPQASTSWDRIQTTIEKYGLAENIPYEDLISNEVDVMDRSLFKIAQGVTKAVDDEIADKLIESRTGSSINSFSIQDTRYWYNSSGAIIDDLLRAKQLIIENNYEASNLMAFITPYQHRLILKYLTDKGAQFPTISAEVASNGNAGNLAGIQLIVNNSSPASCAIVVVPKICATWKELVPLQTDIKEDKFKSKTITACELGVLQLTDPKAVVLINGVA